MAVEGRRNRPEGPLQGTRMIRQVQHLLGRLHSAGTGRDRAGNRRLFCDQYLSLLLLYFFTPAFKSLRALQQATNWEKTRLKLGIRRTSLGSLSEATSVFDAELVRPIIAELAAQAMPLKRGREAEALQGLTAVDGSVFAALPRMMWALWEDETHRGVKLHLHFDVLKGAPCEATLTPAACSEPEELAKTLQPGRLYVLDRGYASYELFARILQAKSSLVARVKEGTAFVPQEERPLDEAARKAGVIRDVVISRLGTSHHKNHVRQPLRLVIVRVPNRSGGMTELWLLTDRLDLPADLVALAYRYRWTVELFFRWMKSVLGARHLISRKRNGVTLQMYAAMIVSLLIILYTASKPNVRTFETLQFYLLGWVTDDELDAHLASLKKVS
jgi:Transposase DDE domain